MDRAVIAAYNQNALAPENIAGEALHLDPRNAEARNQLKTTLTPAQIAEIQHGSGDYAASLEGGQDAERALQNALDGAIRGQILGQWPAEANAAMQYTPEQLAIFNTLREYMMQDPGRLLPSDQIAPTTPGQILGR